jgi:hypothetical protein
VDEGLERFDELADGAFVADHPQPPTAATG